MSQGSRNNWLSSYSKAPRSQSSTHREQNKVLTFGRKSSARHSSQNMNDSIGNQPTMNHLQSHNSQGHFKSMEESQQHETQF